MKIINCFEPQSHNYKTVEDAFENLKEAGEKRVQPDRRITFDEYSSLQRDYPDSVYSITRQAYEITTYNQHKELFDKYFWEGVQAGLFAACIMAVGMILLIDMLPGVTFCG